MKVDSRTVLTLKLLTFAVVSGFLISCETVGYYSQAARGQLDILLNREAITALLEDHSVHESLKQRLRLAVSLKQFAEQELELPATDNFDTYVELDKEHVVWNVFAAPEFSLAPVNWCYPIAGCVSYRGYFKQSDAQSYGEKLQRSGFDVYTGGVDAYSTLGWFNDPLMSTVIKRSDSQLAGLIFHELAHQVVYIKGDTTFNESFATTIEREGVRRWLSSIDKAELHQEVLLDQSRQAEFLELVLNFQQRFETLYAQKLTDEEKRQEKLSLQEEMRSDYEQTKQDWGGYDGYDSWFARSLNNAQLSTVSSYNSLVPFFESELEKLQGDLPSLYARVRELAQMSTTQRQRILEADESAL